MSAQLFIPPGQLLSTSEIRALMLSCLEQKLTGVIVMEDEAGKLVFAFVKRGEVINAGLASAQAYENVSADEWGTGLKVMKRMRTRWVPLSAQSVLIFKLLVQQTPGATEATLTSDIFSILEEQRKKSAISLTKLEWDSALGAVIGCGLAESRYSFYLSAETMQEQADILPIILSSGINPCRVTVFGVDASSLAWQEYLLRRAFTDICEGILVQFQNLAGRAFVESLIRLILVFATRRSLSINITGYKVVDQEFFASPKAAAENYRSLLTEMLVHFSGISGSRLLSSILREIVRSLPEQEQMIIHDFSLLTEGYIYERRN